MSSKVSICIPTFNQARYLEGAIRSALEQDYDNLEVVVSENHCTDGSAEVLARFADPRLRVVRPERHLSMVENFDFCIECSTGEYVTVLCSDDVLLPDYARKVAGALDAHPTAAFAYSAAIMIDEEGRTRSVERHVTGSFIRKGSDEVRRFLKGSGAVFPTLMMRRSCYQRTGGFSKRCAEAVNDWDIQLRLIAVGDVAYHDEVLAAFRVWSTPERASRVLDHIGDIGQLYDTRVAELVVANPQLRRDAEHARRARALNCAAGLGQFGGRAEFNEGARLVLRLSDSAAVRFVLLLHRLGLSKLVIALLNFHLWLRNTVKHGIVLARSGMEGARRRSVSAHFPRSGRNHGVRRVVHGILANLLGQVINASGQILLVPVCLAFWGKQLYGEWLTLSAAVTYMSMLDFGMQMFVVNRLNQCYVREEFGEHTRVLQSALLLSALFSSAALCLAIPAFLLTPVESWFRFSVTSHGTAALVAILLAMQVVTAVPYGLIAGVYRSIGEYPRGQMTNNARTLSTVVLTVVIVAAGGGLAVVAAAQLFALAATSAWVFGDLRRRHPEIHIGFRSADLRLAASFLGPSFLFFLIQTAAALTVQGSVVMVGAIFGAASVAVFVPLRTLANLIRQLSSAVHAALWPELTALETSGKYPALRSIHLLTSKLLVILSLWAGILVHLMGREIVTMWTRHDVLYDPRLMDAFLIMLVAQSPWLTSGLVLAASNNHRRLSICYVLSAVCGLGLGYVASGRFGMPGVVHGLWIADLLICGWFVSWTACRLIGESFANFLFQVLGRGAAFALLFYLAIERLHGLFSAGPDLVGLFGLACSALVVAAGLGLFVFMSRQDRKQLKTFIPGMLPRAAGAA